MTIATAKPAEDGVGFIVTLDDGTVLNVPDDGANRHRKELQEWLDDGNTLDPADPLLPPPTLDEIYDQTILNQRVLKALALALNDGSFVPGSNVTNVQLKAIVKAKM